MPSFAKTLSRVLCPRTVVGYQIGNRFCQQGSEAALMSFRRQQAIAFAACFAWAALAATPGSAQSAAQWPQRPVRLLVTVGAGGAADTLSRNLANGFQQLTGQALVVENR